jgi:hypothetical protein
MHLKTALDWQISNATPKIIQGHEKALINFFSEGKNSFSEDPLGVAYLCPMNNHYGFFRSPKFGQI